MNANERRLRKLEQAIPKPQQGFTASLSECDPALEANDPRLRRGVEEYVYVFGPGTMEPGRKDKRGRGWLNPWTTVDFYGGGKRSSWNKALAMLRADKDLNDDREGRVRHGWLEFEEENGEVRRADTLSVIFLGWSKSWWGRYCAEMEKVTGHAITGAFEYSANRAPSQPTEQEPQPREQYSTPVSFSSILRQ